jgi:hypothetical protein
MHIFDFLRPRRFNRDLMNDLATIHTAMEELRRSVQHQTAIVNRHVIAGPQMVQDALMRIYYLLHNTERLTDPPVHEDRVDPHGNVLLPLDPLQQIELKIVNPFQPEEYYARLILPGAYAHADLLAALPNGVQQWSLHINTYQAPHQLVAALALLQQQAHHCLYLGIRRQVRPGVFSVQFFPSTGLLKRDTPGEFPDEMRLFFEHLGGGHRDEYEAFLTPSTPEHPPTSDVAGTEPSPQ